MKQILDVLRFIVISFESLVLACTYLLYTFEVRWFAYIGEKLLQNTEMLTGLLLVSPIAALTWAYSESKTVLYPEEKNEVLVEWQDFSMLRNRVLYCLALLMAVVLFAVLTLLLKSDLQPQQLAALVLGLFGVLICALVSLGMASLTVRQIIEANR